MTSSKAWCIVMLWCAGCSADGSLERTVRGRIAESGADAVGFYYRDLGTGDTLLVDADVRMHAASTMKVPVMIQVFRDADAGLRALEDRVMVRNEFASIVGGTAFSLDMADDSDSTLYDRVGTALERRALVELMITVSSNLATNVLIQEVDAGRVTATARDLGADSTEVLRGVEDVAAYRAGRSNTTTARDLGVILTAIADDRAASPSSCLAMREILLRQRFDEGIPAGLPPGTPVAHKTGEITGIHHDAAIVYDARGSYVLVILVEGIDDKAESAALMADLSRTVFEMRK